MASLQRVETGKTPQIRVIDCSGDLIVQSWSETAVLIKGDYVLEELEYGWSLSGSGDLRLTVPSAAALAFETVHGDAKIKQVTGDLSMSSIHGDLVLLGVGMLKVGEVQGDLDAKKGLGPLNMGIINGDAIIRQVDDSVALETVAGDLVLRTINGNVAVGQVMGDSNLGDVAGAVSVAESMRDVNLKMVNGPVNIKKAAGDIRLKGGVGKGDHNLRANGDIVVRWPLGRSLNLVAAADQIENRLPLTDLVEKDGSLVGRIGEGETAVNLSAGGRIILKPAQAENGKWEGYQGDAFNMNYVFDFETLGAQISAKVNEQISRVASELESAFGPDFADQMAAKFSRQTERAAAHAERAAERARRHHARYAPPPPRPPAPAPDANKATAAEQLKILRMVEKGAISPEEASMLLDALEA